MVLWTDQRQVEKDIIISRALVENFANDVLEEALRYRGGTALNKLHFPAPVRDSEDIDLVRTSAGPIGPILDQLRVILEPWLGRARFRQCPIAPKFRFRVDAEDGNGVPIRLKIEIDTREIQVFDGPMALPLTIKNHWFSGETAISTFSREEIPATRMRALLQRDKGRDLYDLAHAMEVLEDLDLDLIVDILVRHLDLSGQAISRAQAQERMFAKLVNRRFFARHTPVATGRSGGSHDGYVDRGFVLSGVHSIGRSISRRSLESDSNDERTLRVFVVTEDQPSCPWHRAIPSGRGTFLLESCSGFRAPSPNEWTSPVRKLMGQ